MHSELHHHTTRRKKKRHIFTFGREENTTHTRSEMAVSEATKQQSPIKNRPKWLKLPPFLNRRRGLPLLPSSPILSGAGSSFSRRPSAGKFSCSSSSSQQQQRQQHYYRLVFARFDSDGDGRISGEDLASFFAAVGERVSKEEAERAVGGREGMGYDDFLRLVGVGADHKQQQQAEEGELRRAFEAFEAEKGCGCITPGGLRAALGRMGEARSEEECSAMVSAFDVDGNGVIDYHEFHRMMTACA